MPKFRGVAECQVHIAAAAKSDDQAIRRNSHPFDDLAVEINHVVNKATPAGIERRKGENPHIPIQIRLKRARLERRELVWKFFGSNEPLKWVVEW